nr:hypothetical protein CLUG_02226 [Clavispora lusitaniae]
MELLSHLGIAPAPNATFRSLLLQLRGYLVLWILLRFTVIYHVVSAISSSFSLLSFETDYIKRMSCFCFWRIVSCFIKLNNVTINVSGDALSTSSAIVISNHQSLADYAILAHLASNCGTLCPQPNFFTWFSLWRVPSVKTVYNMLKCDENWTLHKSWADSLFKRVLRSELPEWVILFPEVNIKTPTVTYLQQVQSKRYYLPEFEHVLYPRFSGLHSAITSLSRTPESKFDTLYDITISYEPQPPSLMQFFASDKPLVVYVDVQMKPLSRVPLKRSKLEGWLEKTWMEKEKYLESNKGNQEQGEASSRSRSILDVPLLTIWKTRAGSTFDNIAKQSSQKNQFS